MSKVGPGITLPKTLRVYLQCGALDLRYVQYIRKVLDRPGFPLFPLYEYVFYKIGCTYNCMFDRVILSVITD